MKKLASIIVLLISLSLVAAVPTQAQFHALVLGGVGHAFGGHGHPSFGGGHGYPGYRGYGRGYYGYPSYGRGYYYGRPYPYYYPYGGYPYGWGWGGSGGLAWGYFGLSAFNSLAGAVMGMQYLNGADPPSAPYYPQYAPPSYSPYPPSSNHAYPPPY